MFDHGNVDGSPGTSTNTDAVGPPNMRFKAADDATVDTTNPIGVPGAGVTFYSRWKHIYMKCVTTPPAARADNFRIYSDGANGLGTGRALKIGEQFPTKNSGSSSGYEVANVANEEMVVGHGGITSSVSIFTKTSTSPLVITVSETLKGIDAANETTNYVVMQAEVDETASVGAGSQETLTMSWDEA